MPTLIRRQCHIAAAAAVVRIIFLLQLLRLENVQKEKKNSAVSPPLISFDFDFFPLLSPYVCVDISLVRLSSFLNFIMYFFLDSSSSFLDGRSKQQQQRTKQQHQGFFLTQLRFPYAHSA
jgi:hypothetical protein